MNKENFFEDMDYQLFILLAEVLKVCPDMRYSYENYESINKENLLIFYGSDFRQKSKKGLIVALYNKNRASDTKIKLKELKFFDYRVYKYTKDFSYNIYNWDEDEGGYELETENISFDALIQIIKESFIKHPVDENLLNTEYKKKEYFKNLKISLINLKTEELIIFTENLKSLFKIKENSLEEMQSVISKLKYCILKSDFENISYGKIPKEIFKEITSLYCFDNGIVEDKKCFDLLRNKFNCEPIKRLHYLEKYILIEIE